MISRIRTHLNAATLVAIIALVFAMTGGALAVGGHGGGARATASAKGKGKAGPRGPAGPAGKEGKPGPEGKQGPSGKEGPPGKEGSEGKQGPAGKEGPAGRQGYRGESGFVETLPPGKTETGTWSFAAPSEADIFVSISFPIRLAEALQGSGCSGKTTPCQVHWITSGTKTTECPGSAQKPEAAIGNLCVYEGQMMGKPSRVPPTIFSPNSFLQEGAGTTGAVVLFGSAEGGEASGAGDWAVTAPEEEK